MNNPALKPLNVRNPMADIENTPITLPRMSSGAGAGLMAVFNWLRVPMGSSAEIVAHRQRGAAR
jgi:hypothetical protein